MFRTFNLGVTARLSSLTLVNVFSRLNTCQPIDFNSLGISHAYGGVLSALSVHYTLKPVGDAHSQRWIEKEVVSALYVDRQEILASDEREVVGEFWHDES